MKYEFIAVDLQNDFTTEGGKWYTPKPSIKFIKDKLFPFLREKGIKVNEIISDYRKPRIGHRGHGCYPGTFGYESILPEDLRKSQWIKAMNSPVWVRDNIGQVDKEPGVPYQDPEKFSKWIAENIGELDDVTPVLFGLTVDCCVLSVAQEFCWRGMRPIIIIEATDHSSGREEDKIAVLEKSALRWWSTPMHWEEFKSKL